MKDNITSLDSGLVDRALTAFNGGMVRVSDSDNSRGYVDYYRPKEAMLAALQAADRTAREMVLEEALRDARKAIASLDEFALGGADVPDFYSGEVTGQYGIRDELLAKIDRALKDQSNDRT